MRAIIILGAAVWEDGPSPALFRRAQHGGQIFHQNKGDIVIACGALGRFPPSEARAIHGLLRASHVPEAAIIAEDASTTTYENIRNAARILRPLGIRNTTIVTDRFHAPRAKLTALAFGLRAVVDTPAPSPIPRAIAIKRIMREIVGLPVYALCLGFWRWRDR